MISILFLNVVSFIYQEEETVMFDSLQWFLHSTCPQFLITFSIFLSSLQDNYGSIWPGGVSSSYSYNTNPNNLSTTSTLYQSGQSCRTINSISNLLPEEIKTNIVWNHSQDHTLSKHVLLKKNCFTNTKAVKNDILKTELSFPKIQHPVYSNTAEWNTEVCGLSREITKTCFIWIKTMW